MTDKAQTETNGSARPKREFAWGYHMPRGKRRKAGRKMARHTCMVCGATAYSRANAGWACAQHYDTLS